MKDAAGNSYELNFLPMEAGATLSFIAYRGSFEGNTPAQYLAALQDRFGKPSPRLEESGKRRRTLVFEGRHGPGMV